MKTTVTEHIATSRILSESAEVLIPRRLGATMMTTTRNIPTTKGTCGR